MGEISFAPEGQRQPDESFRRANNVEKSGETKKVPGVKTRDKTVRRLAESPKIVRGKNDDLKQAEYLGDFFEKVVPTRIAVEMIKDYKEKVGKELKLKGIDKNKYYDPDNYKKAVKEVSDKIVQGFKLFEKKLYERDKTKLIMRGEASINEVELDNVFEGKNIKLLLKEGDVAEKEYKNMLKFQDFLPDSLPKVYDYFRFGDTGILSMEKIDDGTMEQLFKDKNFNTILKTRPKLFFDLGKIIAIMDNNYFVHGDFFPDNIIFTKDYVWKIIDFESSRYYGKEEAIKAQKFTSISNIEQIGRNIGGFISDNPEGEQIEKDFYDGYLINRNLKEDIQFLYTKKYNEGLIKILRKIKTPSVELRSYLNSLISELGVHSKGFGKTQKEINALMYLKNGIEKFLEKETMVK